jgi:hypothetical protein
VLVVPTQEGYGTRVKIIEALCEGVVVVSSQTGIEGIKFNKKTHLLLFVLMIFLLQKQ